MSYTPGLTWPRSDGSETTWPTPEEQRPSGEANWWEQLPLNHEKYRSYEAKIGEAVAAKKGMPGAKSRMPLPHGYALFAHHKPHPGGIERVDVYLRGCPSIGRKQFRSPNEFIPHAEWLIDESKDISDHSTCGCIYNNSSAAAQAKKAGSSSLGGTGLTPKRATYEGGSKKRKESSADSEDRPSAIVPERAVDMQTGRRFRKGESVWFRIDTISPPDPNPKEIPPITHWPGLIANATKREKVQTEMIGNVPSSASATVAMSSGGQPAHRPPTVIGYWEYSVRPLGFFSPSAEVIKTTEGMSPWALGNESSGGGKGWESSGKEGTRVMRERVNAEASDLKGKGIPIPTDEGEIDKRWKLSSAQRYTFRDMPKSWDSAVFRLGIAIKIGTLITNSWTQTDKIDMVPGVEVNPEDLEAIQSQVKTSYQGLWWGGERIWLEDVVRLKKHRVESPAEALGYPAEGAADRAVSLRIRMITSEIAPDSAEDPISWRCSLYGDVLEVVDGEEANAIPKDEREWALYSPKPPAGHHYRQSNPAGTEITVDIMDVAGRVYPDLLDPSTQTWFTDSRSSESENASRVAPGDTAKALAGLKPGTVVGARSDKWKEGSYTIVNEANKITERDMKRFYETSSHGPKAKASNAAPASNGSAVPSNGTTSVTA